MCYKMVDTCARGVRRTRRRISTPAYDVGLRGARASRAAGKPVVMVLGIGSHPHRTGHRVRLQPRPLRVDAPGAWAMTWSSSTTTPRPSPPTTTPPTASTSSRSRPEDVMSVIAGRAPGGRGRRLRRADGNQADAVPRPGGSAHPRHLRRQHRHRRGPRPVRRTAGRPLASAARRAWASGPAKRPSPPRRRWATRCCCARPMSSAGRI